MAKSEKKQETVIDVYAVHTELLEKGLIHGQEWVDDGVGLLLSVTQEIKVQDAVKEDKCRLLMIQLATVKKPFDAALKVLKDLSQRLRKKLLEEYVGVAPITVEGVGEISFKQQWGYTVVDEGAIPEEYTKKVVDVEKLQTDIDNGIRVIAGVDIKKVRTVVVAVSK